MTASSRRYLRGLSPEEKLNAIGWDVTASGCWEWRGRRRRTAGQEYGRIDIGPVSRETHRLAFELWVRALEPGEVVLHSCDNPPCINPAHLRAGSIADNMADRDRKGRQVNQAKSHCKQGHEFTPENTYYSTNAEGNPRRHCRTCKRRWNTEAYRRRAALKPLDPES